MSEEQPVRNVKIGENRYRETFGRFYEDFEVGTVYEHRPRRTITEVDVMWMPLLCTGIHGLHFDAIWGEQTEWGKNPLGGTFTLMIVSGMSITDLNYKSSMNLGFEEVKFLNPVFAGDTISAETKIVDKRLSESREGDGIVVQESTGFKQTGDPVVRFTRASMIPTREKGFPMDDA